MSRFEALSADKVRGMQREPWERLEKEFARIHGMRGQFAGEAFFYQARSREELADRSKNKADYQEAVRLYSRMAQSWPNHALADNALYNQAMIFSGPLKDKKSAVKALDQLILQYPSGDMVKEAVVLRERLENGSAAARPATRQTTATASQPARQPASTGAGRTAEAAEQPNYGVLNAPGAAARPAQTAQPQQGAAQSATGQATQATQAAQTAQATRPTQTAAQADPAPTKAQQNKQRELYQAAAAEWKQLTSGKHPRSAHRDVWENLEKKFKAALAAAPSGSFADKAAFQAARCREELAERSKSAADWKEAAVQFGLAAEKYPKSTLADDSLYARAAILADRLNSPAQSRQVCAQILQKYPNGDMIQKTRALLQRLPAATASTGGPGDKATAGQGGSGGKGQGDSGGSGGKGQGAPGGQTTAAQRGSTPGATSTATSPGASAAASGSPAQQGKPTGAQSGATASGQGSSKPAQGSASAAQSTGSAATGSSGKHQPALGQSGTAGMKAPASGATLSRLSWKGDAAYFTLTIELAGSAKYRRNTLPPNDGGTARIQLDLLNTRLDPKVLRQLEYAGLPVRSVRSSQVDKNTARVNIEADGARSYKVSVLRNPYRLQVEISANKLIAGGHDLGKTATAASGQTGGAPRRSNGTIVEQLGLSVKTIVVDAGHGGSDPGAIGNGITERTYTLELAKMLGQRLQKKGFTVIYTRTGNNYVALKDRTTFANDKKADIFISIHVNSSTNKKLSGVETYYLDTARSNAASVVAARENAVDVNATSDLQFILSDLTRNTKLEESKALAALVQNKTLAQLQKGGFSVKNNGVRSAPFYVLMGARMPAFLLEVGYLSNSSDAARLKNKKYMERLADGVTDGIVSYRNKINSLKP